MQSKFVLPENEILVEKGNNLKSTLRWHEDANVIHGCFLYIRI